MNKFQITRIKINSNKVWVEINEGFDSNPFKDPLTTVPSEEELRKIQEWCDLNQCGVRMSYDQFVFNSEQELSMFMLKWS